MQQSQPNFFGQALGSGTNPMIKLALGGIAALGLGRLMAGGEHHGGGGGIFGGGQHGGGFNGLFGSGHHQEGHH